MNISYQDFGLKSAVFSCLTNAIAPRPIVLESCSRAVTDQTVFSLHSKKIFCWGLGIFCEWHHKWSDFWVVLPGLRPNR